MNITDPAIQAKFRIVSGLTLLFYVSFHFLNHALGLWSLEALQVAGHYFRTFWRWLPATIALYGALLVHVFFSLNYLYQRRSLKMSWKDGLRIILGLSIPLIMAIHILATRGAHELFGLSDDYSYILVSTFVQSPSSGIQNAIGLVIVWSHGYLGLYGWMKSKPWFKYRHRSIFWVGFALTPVLSLLGFLSAGRQIYPLTLDEEWMALFYEDLSVENFDFAEFIFLTTEQTQYTFMLVIILLLLARILRSLIIDGKQHVSIEYAGGKIFKSPMGTTLLEISRLNNIPHASICGGKGRCSTCRVRILNSSKQSPPSEDEQKVLDRVGAHPDVRLACQFVPSGELKIALMFPPDTSMGEAVNSRSQSSGVEQVAVVMFADIRGFTQQSEQKLPFDVVYLVNQFAESMGKAIEAHGGTIDKFLGDGLMAIFGIDGTPEQGSRDALLAAHSMLASLDELNVRLEGSLEEPLRIGIGIHAGAVVLGEMGYGKARGLSAIGDVVNTASRLESATKELNAVVCFSQAVSDYAGLSPDTKYHRNIQIRGKSGAFSVYAAAAVTDFELPSIPISN